MRSLSVRWVGLALAGLVLAGYAAAQTPSGPALQALLLLSHMPITFTA